MRESHYQSATQCEECEVRVEVKGPKDKERNASLKITKKRRVFSLLALFFLALISLALTSLALIRPILFFVSSATEPTDSILMMLSFFSFFFVTTSHNTHVLGCYTVKLNLASFPP
jgi:membrane-anchored glycerophosphoryl diester phosphodiesterase (GDPDase)